MPITELKYRDGEIADEYVKHIEKIVESVLDGRCLDQIELIKNLLGTYNPARNDIIANEVLKVVYDKIEKGEIVYARLAPKASCFFRDVYYALAKDDVRLSRKVKYNLTCMEASIDNITDTNSPRLSQALFEDELEEEERRLTTEGVISGPI